MWFTSQSCLSKIRHSLKMKSVHFLERCKSLDQQALERPSFNQWVQLWFQLWRKNFGPDSQLTSGCGTRLKWLPDPRRLVCCLYCRRQITLFALSRGNAGSGWATQTPFYCQPWDFSDSDCRVMLKPECTLTLHTLMKREEATFSVNVQVAEPEPHWFFPL